MKVLVLGGTVFLGRHVVERALARGHDVTLFNRGVHGPHLFPEVRKLRGDRTHDLSALTGDRWDVVVDTSGYDPHDVAASVAALASRVERYVFVSTVSVYRDWPAFPVDEGSATFHEEDEPNYGVLKAACERAAEAAMPGRVLHVRSALLVGPYENVGRLPYWLGRVATYDEIVAPGRPDRQIQLHDARDLAAWMLEAAESGLAGVFNTGSPSHETTMGDMLRACLDATGSQTQLHWLDDQLLLAAGVEPWSELPLWAPETDEFAGAFAVDVTRAVAHGLRARPLHATVADTWGWLRHAPASELGAYREHQAGRVLDRRKEEQLLASARR